MLTHIVQKIKELQETKKTVIVAIDGYSGSGKSTFAKRLQSEFEGSQIVQMDDFASPNGSGLETDLDRLEKQVLMQLDMGLTARYQKYLWTDKIWEPSTISEDFYQVAPGQLIILEGVYSMYPQINHYTDLKVWINCEDCPFERGKKRDIEEHGLDPVEIGKVWEKWKKKQQFWMEQIQPWARADFIVQEDKNHKYQVQLGA